MRHFYYQISILFLLLSNHCSAQQSKLDSLKNRMETSSGASKVELLLQIAGVYYKQNEANEELSAYLEALRLAEDIEDSRLVFAASYEIAFFYTRQQKYPLALSFALKAKEAAEVQGSQESLFSVLNLIGGIIYFNQGRFDSSLSYGTKLMALAEKMQQKERLAEAQMYMGDVYREQEKYLEAVATYHKALAVLQTVNNKSFMKTCLNNIGIIYSAKGSFDTAILYYQKALEIAKATSSQAEVGQELRQIFFAYYQKGDWQKAIATGKQALEMYQHVGDKSNQLELLDLLGQIHTKQHNHKAANYYYNEYIKNSRYLNEVERQKVDSVQFQHEQRVEQKEAAYQATQARLQNNVRNLLIGSSLLFLALLLLISNRYKLKRKSLTLLSSTNAELSKALSELKATQAQLVQREKMASLGELTAGIAHEIQNPLNFVNNFSEAAHELADELEQVLAQGDTREAKVLVADIRSNTKKIVHHGKRADNIVKGMLQHARASTEKIESTNINQLTEEYLRLSYQGIRAKDQTFAASIETNFDASLQQADVVPQDIGRVLLNLFNNAFYAVSEKKKRFNGTFEPVVSVSTKKEANQIVIAVKDNGTGMSPKVADKVFQPFFTTKPTGEGTGLGLALSYDIITKGHGGNLSVQSTEGEGSTFVVELPIQ
jgi:signal transduction histidine kinase